MQKRLVTKNYCVHVTISKVHTVGKTIILRAAKFVGSKIMLILAINLVYSKFGEISPSVSRLPGYESVVKGAVHITGQKVIFFSTNLWGY